MSGRRAAVRSMCRRTAASGLFCALACIATVLGGTAAQAQGTILVEYGSDAAYRVNTEIPGLDRSWTEFAFDDSAWPTGSLGIGYETGEFPPGAESLIGTPVPTGAASIYIRAEFEIADLALVTGMTLGADYDDGWAAWINGVEVYRSPELPEGDLAWNTPAAEHESSNLEQPIYRPVYDLSDKALPVLRTGTNVLAVGVWNSGTGSSDLVVVPRLAINQPVELIRGPYLQRGGPDRTTVRWRTSVAASSTVRFGTAPDALDTTVVDPEERVDHVVELTGLDPDTRYYYEVESGGVLLSVGDGHTFLTAPPPGSWHPFRTWVLGDSGTGDNAARAVRDAYYAFAGDTETDIWLMLGDNAYFSGTDEEHQLKLFDIYPTMLKRSVLWPTIGNHDAIASDSNTQTGPYFDIFTLPTVGESGGLSSGTEAYYSFDYANVHFVVLDSHETSRLPGAAMLTWLEQDLAATTQDWIIAYWHHPPYSKGKHDSDVELRLIEMREYAVPILEDYGVDLVMSGHSHSYERSFLIDGHYGDSTTFGSHVVVDGGSGIDAPYIKPHLGNDPHRGTVYTVAGSSGGISGGALDHPAMYVAFSELGSLVLDVAGDRLDVRFLDATATVLDHFVMRKGLRAPIAQFDGSPLSGVAPLTVGFTDLAQNAPTDWEWDFDDDGFVDSLLQNPTHVYTDPGRYSVRFGTSNLAGDDETTREDLICVHRGDPDRVSGLTIGPLKGELSWDGQPDAGSYDLVRGNLGLLRGSGGDFGSALLTCLGENVGTPWAADGSMPAPGQSLMYLVRATNCAPVTGSFDSEGARQVGPRDLTLQGLDAGCACAPADDLDSDGYCNGLDNCPGVVNDGQADFDGDGFGDPCDDCTDGDGDGFGDPGFPASLCGNDNCPLLPNDQLDRDLDGVGDACDRCPLDAADDFDGDGLCADVDNCPEVANIAQADVDDDGLGDACDYCPGDLINDPDKDGICGEVDNCPFAANEDQADLDQDGPGDACDTCTDSDGDGLGDPGFEANTCDTDNCVDLPNPGQADFDRDDIGDACDTCNDSDQDGYGNLGFPDNECFPDNCPFAFNPNQLDMDADAIGDACDSCPRDPDNDIDGDGACENDDNCPYAPNPGQENADDDHFGDACDPCTDTDGDGHGDPGFDASSCGVDNCPSVFNPDQKDVDTDGFGDLCDVCPTDAANDEDHDSVCGSSDNCPAVANPAQNDHDADGAGDRCDPCTDTDNDGFGDPGFGSLICPDDNCPLVRNPGQKDTDSDGLGDNCDACRRDADNDIDADGVCGDQDNCPTVGNPDQADDDADGVGEICDACPGDPLGDVDGDGLCSSEDNCPTVPNPFQIDSDENGIGNPCEFVAVTVDAHLSATEVTNAQYARFLNAVAVVDTHELYNHKMFSDAQGGIVRTSGESGSTYSTKPSMADKPVTYVSWLDAARYANWLHNGRPTGPQDATTTETGAYDLTGSDAGAIATRSTGAEYFLPTAEEWLRAAYFNPTSGTSTIYPTRSDETPTPATADDKGDISNPGFNVANYDGVARWNGNRPNVTRVAGAGPLSASAFGTYDQGGNVAEWTETRATVERRRVFGGSFEDPAEELASAAHVAHRFDREEPTIGFRIASRVAR